MRKRTIFAVLSRFAFLLVFTFSFAACSESGSVNETSEEEADSIHDALLDETLKEFNESEEEKTEKED